jgi:hyperosmotically inducible protein
VSKTIKLFTNQGRIMKTRLVATCLIFSTLLGSAAAWSAEESHTGRPRPVIFVKNSAITTAVKARLAAAHIVGLGRIHVDTDKDGVVWLTGNAGTKEAIDKAASMVRETEHVTAVYNGLKVRKLG